jgi:hypothetical protein
MLMLAFSRFVARKPVGIYMIVLYALFIIYSILGEFEVMHP